jgi:ornithine carbamoyltransferase
MPVLPPKHFLQIRDFTLEEFEYLIARTRWIKDRFKRYELYQPLRDRTLAMVFEKASTRTRVSFEAGMNQLGGIRDQPEPHRHAPVARRADRGRRARDLADGRRRDDPDVRAGDHRALRRALARPVINGLTNEYHPCQILADIYTYIEHRGPIRGRTGRVDRRLEQRLQHVAPGGGDLRLRRSRVDAARLRVRCGARGAIAGGRFRPFADPRAACRDADLVTTDVWTSMGFESENDARQAGFRAMAGRRPP